MEKYLEWWNELPLQNLKDMNHSWVGYVWKYYPHKTDCQDVTKEEILQIWLNENPLELRRLKIKKIKNK